MDTNEEGLTADSSRLRFASPSQGKTRIGRGKNSFRGCPRGRQDGGSRALEPLIELRAEALTHSAVCLGLEGPRPSKAATKSAQRITTESTEKRMKTALKFPPCLRALCGSSFSSRTFGCPFENLRAPSPSRGGFAALVPPWFSSFSSKRQYSTSILRYLSKYARI